MDNERGDESQSSNIYSYGQANISIQGFGYAGMEYELRLTKLHDTNLFSNV